jgi:hypothetical protein
MGRAHRRNFRHRPGIRLLQSGTNSNCCTALTESARTTGNPKLCPDCRPLTGHFAVLDNRACGRGSAEVATHPDIETLRKMEHKRTRASTGVPGADIYDGSVVKLARFLIREL